MSNTHIALAITCLLLVVTALTGRATLALLIAFLGSVFILPNALTTLGYDRNHVGIAAGFTTIYSYSIVLALAVCFVALKGRRVFSTSIYLIAGYLLLGLLLWWGNTPYQQSGVALLFTAMAAVVFGRYIGNGVQASSFLERSLVASVSALLIFEAIVCVAQSVGLELPGLSLYSVTQTTADTTAGRVYGTTDHPGTLGKITFMALALLLPSLNSSNRQHRTLAALGISAALVCLILSEGRANFYAAIILIALWTIAPSNKSGLTKSRVGLVAVTAVAFITSYGIFLDRFQEASKNNLQLNPRTHLMGIALRNLPNWIIPGTGPNSYVDVIGQTDALTAKGWPVHNTAMLLLMELGIVGFLFAAFAGTRHIVQMFRCRSLGQSHRSQSTAFFCALPGFAIIAWTGWGLNGGISLIMFAFYLGYTRGATDSCNKKSEVSKVKSESTVGVSH